jgi:hypothetical protein
MNAWILRGLVTCGVFSVFGLMERKRMKIKLGQIIVQHEKICFDN